MTQQQDTNQILRREFDILEVKVDKLMDIQSDLRDSVVALTHNQKEISRIGEQMTHVLESVQTLKIEQEIQKGIIQSHSDKLKDVGESRVINRIIIFLAGLIATGVIGTAFMVLNEWLKSSPIV